MSKQAVKTIAALAVFAAGGLALLGNLKDSSSSPSPGVGADALESDDMPPLDAPLDSAPLAGLAVVTDFGGGEVPARIEADLLALYGSFDPTTEIRDAFAVPDRFFAAPRGESVSQPLGTVIDWESRPDPTRMLVTLIVITADDRRASIDGAVVRVGDRVSAGRITQIAEHGVRVSDRGLSLFYEPQQPYPREFLPELERRGEAGHDTPTTPTEDEKP